MPYVIIARRKVKGGGYEILLQRRSGSVDDAYTWGVISGGFSKEENSYRMQSGLHPSVKARISRRAALRECCEEAGGGSMGGMAPVTHTLERIVQTAEYPREVNRVSFDRVILPPGLLAMEHDPSCVFELPKHGFLYLIDERDPWAKGWVPRALPSDRWEIDEAWNGDGNKGKPGAWGYVWVPLEMIQASFDRPLGSLSSMPIQGTFGEHFGLALNAQLENLSLRLASRHAAAAAAAGGAGVGVGVGVGAAAGGAGAASSTQSTGAQSQSVNPDSIKVGDLLVYTKNDANVLVRIERIHRNDPPDLYFEIVFEDGTLKQTVAKYLRRQNTGEAPCPPTTVVPPYPRPHPGGPRLCRVKGCKACQPGATHNCVLCGSTDSDHRSSECPEAKIVYFIRHGQSEENRRKDPSLPNSELSAEGRFQATTLRDYMVTQGVEMVVSSPLIRAIHTAQLVFNGMLIPHIIDPYWRESGGDLPPNNRAVAGRMIEASLGSTFGSLPSHPQFDVRQIRSLDRREHALWQPEEEAADPDKWGAKIRMAVRDSALRSLVNQSCGKRVLSVVTHWCTLSDLFGLNARNCEVFRICVRPGRVFGERGRWILTKFNASTGTWERAGGVTEWG